MYFSDEYKQLYKNIQSILYKQDQFLEKGLISINKRIEALKSLKEAIKYYESDIMTALKKDLGKCSFEAYSTEVGFIYSSISYAIKNIRKWNKIKKVKSEVAQWIGKSLIYKSPYGKVLIIGPYNYPFQLLFEPLLGAIAGGNTAVLKPSEFTPNVECVIKKIINKAFKEEYVTVVTGDYKVNSVLLDMKFDYIFFTGSVGVGKIVMQKASQNLIPVTLELGGKSPVIVHESAKLSLAAKRIMWGKLTNAGQTCVAPDYVLAHVSIYDKLLEELKRATVNFFGNDIKSNSEFGRIVNGKHMNRLKHILERDKNHIYFGGNFDMEDKYIAPTILKDINLENESMKEEVFGPILPVIPYNDINDISLYLKAHKNPLALYVFTENMSFGEYIIKKFSFGGGCINDTISHVASKSLPFGGVGTSGMGRYHGKSSFDCFTYEKAIVKKSTKIELKLVFPPYKNRLVLVKKFFMK